jgi:capsular exopolysaccharide synthesis family protein
MSRNFEMMQKAAASLTGAPISESSKRPARASQAKMRTTDAVPLPMNIGLDQMACEEVLRLIHSVFHTPGQERHAVVFTAISSGSGCSWICSKTAEILARSMAKSVCLVDANFRTPCLSQVFGTTNHYGLSDALREERPVRDFVKRLQPSNVWLLSCGSVPGASVSLLSSAKMATLVGELRQEFDLVLIDAPPIGAYADTLRIGQLGDGLVLVLEANVTRREVAARVAERMRETNMNILGAVLNKWTFPIPESVYRRI